MIPTPTPFVRRILVGTVLAASSAVSPAAAWTDESRVRILRQAVRLMPESLREMMVRHERQLLTAALDPGSAEDQPEHWQHPEGEYGTAARRAEDEARALVRAVNGRARFDGIVGRFGRLAHWVSDVCDPLHAGDRDDRLRLYYADYQRYVQQQIPRFRLVFEGYRAPTLSASGPAAFLMESAARSREYARSVGRAYDEDGERISVEAFDVRSLAFGVGALAYSHAVNDVVRVWLWAWEQANGDVTRTPYPLDDPEARDDGDGSERASMERPAP